MDQENTTGTTFTHGYESGQTGEPRTANPHMPYSIAEMHWFAGWDLGSTKRSKINVKPNPEMPANG